VITQLRVLPQLIACSALLFSCFVHAERYYVTEDSFGNFDAAPVDESKLKPELNVGAIASEADGADLPEGKPSTETPNTEKLSTEELDQVRDVLVKEGGAGNDSSKPFVVERHQPKEQASGSVDVEAELEAKTGTPSTIDGAAPNKKASLKSDRDKEILGAFERAYLDTEGVSPYDATVVDDADFVDGDDLLQGRVRGEGKQPYFIVTDPDGNQFTTFYSPDLARQARLDSQTKLKYTEATIFHKEHGRGLLSADIPSGADPIAVSILSGGNDGLESYFDSFSKRCCSKLPTVGLKVIDFERPYHLSLLKEDLPYRFNEGDSRYLIFKLPELKKNFAIQLRAFIRKYKKESVEHGVFFPQLVMLDKTKQPLRIISDPVLKYVPETWSGYGYLEGIFEIERSEALEEVFVLLNTTKNYLKTVSHVEGEFGLLQVEHMTTGEFGVKALYSEAVSQ